MSLYAVADGHDVPLESLVLLTPQPFSPGIQYAVRVVSANGTPMEEGAYCRFVYSALGSAASYLAVLTQWGLHNATYNDVTVRLRDRRFQWVRMNGRALIPPSQEWRIRPRNIEIVVRDLVASS